MNRLQGLRTHEHYLVTLNDPGRIDPKRVIYQVDYTHPVYTPESIGAQNELRRLSGTRNTFFCGAYFGYGFHEDGVRSGVDVGSHFGLTL
jgi:predicted NAD/FAD-binding protein